MIESIKDLVDDADIDLSESIEFRIQMKKSSSPGNRMSRPHQTHKH